MGRPQRSSTFAGQYLTAGQDHRMVLLDPARARRRPRSLRSRSISAAQAPRSQWRGTDENRGFTTGREPKAVGELQNRLAPGRPALVTFLPGTGGFQLGDPRNRKPEATVCGPPRGGESDPTPNGCSTRRPSIRRAPWSSRTGRGKGTTWGSVRSCMTRTARSSGCGTGPPDVSRPRKEAIGSVPTAGTGR